MTDMIPVLFADLPVSLEMRLITRLSPQSCWRSHKSFANQRRKGFLLSQLFRLSVLPRPASSSRACKNDGSAFFGVLSIRTHANEVCLLD